MSDMHVKVTLKPTKVIESLIDKFEQLTIEEHQLKATDNALVAVGGHGKSQSKKGNSGNKKSDMECWKCRYKGHIQAKCCVKKKGWQGKKKTNLKKVKDSSNVTTEGKVFAFTTTFTRATLACNRSPLAELEVDVYDSGASSHMSPA